ncbi:hypothetical protein J3R83DRAFT_7802 [Lanmaoa asiatica]|nr:hypothetical protein J3R83DRAFT_7802 [Lanmaoa asiatica]
MEFSCTTCCKTFSSQEALSRHRSNKHAQTFVVTSNDVQYRVSAVEGRYYCPIEGCGKAYEGKDGLRKHVKDRHNFGRDGSTPVPSAKNPKRLQQQSSIQVPRGLTYILQQVVPFNILFRPRRPNDLGAVGDKEYHKYAGTRE